ncbi:helix-turn-helix domain-containing protein [Sphingopyxis solisilvae]|uniref:helix-turn-helix domain-containing protein n=2 Tax=Sphingopyxis solisilvae TaxID=1886788 RepID=UPI004035BC96
MYSYTADRLFTPRSYMVRRMVTDNNRHGREAVPGPAPYQADEPFGARLRRLRRLRRLSQTQLANALRVSVPAVSAWEKNRSRPRHARIEALGRVLGVSSAELLGSDAGRLSADLLAESRIEIARLVGTTPEKVRILIEF